MDFNIDRADIAAAIDKCSVVTDNKATNEAFRLMLVKAGKTQVRFAASGEHSSVDTVTKCEVKSQGEFVVMPGRLRDIVSSMPAGRINISLKGERVTVKSLVSSRKSTFQRHTCDLKPVEDPGKGAAWQELKARPLAMALRMVKRASTHDVRDDPTTSLLIPTERGLDVFGCNSYLLALVESNQRMDGSPIQVPEAVASVLNLMVDMDDDVRIFADESRTYLENADTLVSGLHFQAYPYKGDLLGHIMTMLRKEEHEVGPTVQVKALHEATKSLMSLASFAGDSEKGARGLQLHAVFGRDTVVVEVNLQNADGRNEFDVITPGAEIEAYLSSSLFEKLLGSLEHVEQAQIRRRENMIFLRSQDVFSGIMVEEKK